MANHGGQYETGDREKVKEQKRQERELAKEEVERREREDIERAKRDV